MSTRVPMSKGSKGKTVVTTPSRHHNDGVSTARFDDVQRSEADAQQQLPETVSHSPHEVQLKAVQNMADNSTLANSHTQVQKMADNYTSQTMPVVQKNENDTGLSDDLKTGMESISGESLDDVKVYRNSVMPAQLHAHAYSQGSDIHIAPGQEKYLPHEAWHVVQQKQGRVKATQSLADGVSINTDAKLETEADQMGGRVSNAISSGDGTQPDKSLNSQTIQQNIIQLGQDELQYHAAPAGVFEVTDSKALIRLGPPTFKTIKPKSKIPQGAQVRVTKSASLDGKYYSHVVEELPPFCQCPPDPYGWTSHSNLTLFTPPTQEELEAYEAEKETLEKQEIQRAKEIEQRKKERTALGDFDAYEVENFEPGSAEHAKGKKALWSGTNMTNYLLDLANIDQDKFWNSFTTINLFGRKATSLHRDFANLLLNVEKVTVDKISTSPDFAAWQQWSGNNGKNAKTVGKFLGIISYSTIRTEDKNSDNRSFHQYGMAIDINYRQNPWISDSSGKMGKVKVKDKKTDKHVMVDSKTQQLQNMLDRVGGLLHKTFTFKHVNPTTEVYDMMDLFDNNAKIDKAIELYFSLMDVKNADILEMLIRHSIFPEWSSKTVEEAREVVEKDFERMAELWSRKGDEGKASMIENGIMDLDRRLVQSMDRVGLDWGGKYGDMMHFDMRLVGLGSKIKSAKNSGAGVAEYKRIKAENDKVAAEKKEAAKAAEKAKKEAKKAERDARKAEKNAKK